MVRWIVLEYRVKGLIGSLEVFSLNTNSFRPSCGYTLTLTCDVAYILNTVKKEKVHFITLYFVLFCKKRCKSVERALIVQWLLLFQKFVCNAVSNTSDKCIDSKELYA